jgi:radical SAM protein with 4Fe4S-binding SPASM domain
VVTNSQDGHFLPNIEDLLNFEKQMDLLIKMYKRLILANQKVYCGKILDDIKIIHNRDSNEIGCIASREGVHMDIEGNIYPCSYHTSSMELSVGNIYEGIDYEKIIEKGWYAKHVNTYKACENCWLKYLCSGSCLAIKWLENGNTDTPSKYLCSVYDIYYTAIVKLYIQLHSVITSGTNFNFSNIEK